MHLLHGNHLAYCTNVHRGESWTDTLAKLEQHTLKVRERVASGEPYAIGLRLAQRAAAELSQPETLTAFQRWLEKHGCYVFTINGFPYGDFHGARVKENAYAPDWSTPERLAYTQQLFTLIATLAPADAGGSVSTVPGSFKAWTQREPARREAILANLSRCAEHIARLSQKTGKDLHLGIEPEPACTVETTEETLALFADWREVSPRVESEGWLRYVGVNYDCCHLAVEFESARTSLQQLTDAGLRISKLHISSALKVQPTADARAALSAFVEPRYLHQVVVAERGAVTRRYVDLPDALADTAAVRAGEEWRIHYHLPLHAAPGAPFADTRDHVLDALDWLKLHPHACRHFEMETYTWEVLPAELQLGIEEQLIREYAWTLEALAARGLVGAGQASRLAAGILT
ncbi:MAG TPA: metabolite traffic protein EboE [Opitutaceae bacterium]|nr:metabolite traffic protein EboE [Opitutaceae bacterium]